MSTCENDLVKSIEAKKAFESEMSTAARAGILIGVIVGGILAISARRYGLDKMFIGFLIGVAALGVPSYLVLAEASLRRVGRTMF